MTINKVAYPKVPELHITYDIYNPRERDIIFCLISEFGTKRVEWLDNKLYIRFKTIKDLEFMFKLIKKIIKDI